MMFRKFRLTVCMLIVVSLLLSACGATVQAEPERPPLRVEYTIWEGDYTLLIAQEKGFFKKHGVQVEPVYYEIFSEAILDIAANKIDVGLFSLGDLFSAASLSDLKGVMVYDSGGTSALVSAADVQSVTDLKGKKIGVLLGSYQEMFVREVLKSGGLTMADVTLINTQVEEVPVKIPAEIQAGFTWEPYTTEAVKNGGRILYGSQGTPLQTLFVDVVVFRDSVLRQRPADVRAFVDAWFEALEWREAHPEESLAIIAKQTGMKPEEIVLGDVDLFDREDNQELFREKPAGDLSSIYNIAQVHLNFMIENGRVTTPPDLKELLDPSFLSQ